MKSPFKRPAFTLVELLIVITIIGILAVALVPRISGGPARARDAKRQADLNSLSLALELYSNDHGGAFPDSACLNGTNDDLDPYMSTGIPSEPSASNLWPDGAPLCGGEAGYIYVHLTPSTGSEGYVLLSRMENSLATAENIYLASSIDASDADTTATAILAGATLCDGSNCAEAGATLVLGR